MKNKLGIYIHIPFCISKCPYCDFNSYAVNSVDYPNFTSVEDNYTEALIAELTHQREHMFCHDYEVVSVFFGGGTPSLFSAQSLASLVHAVDQTFGITDSTEITLEANPGSLREELAVEKLIELRQSGFNRVSFGVQSFSESKLRFLGRIHSADDALHAFDISRKAGFSNINLDLIFALKDETLQMWSEDLLLALDLQPEHLSLYGLTIEPGTDFGRRAKKNELLTADEETFSQMYLYNQRQLTLREYRQYETSNFALQNRQCRHNQIYWSGESYLGLGAGAHSFLKNAQGPSLRWSNIPGPYHYLQRIKENKVASQLSETLSAEQEELEFLFLRLRRTEGISFAEYEKQFGRSFLDLYRPLVEALSSGKMLKLDEAGICIMNDKMHMLDSILLEFAQFDPPKSSV